MTPQEIYQRYLWAGAMTRNADALVGLFAADGVLEAPTTVRRVTGMRT